MRKISCVLLIILLSACATMSLDTPAKKYYAVRVQFNDLVEQYLPYQDKIDADTRADIKTAIKEVDFALDTWGKFVSDPNYSYASDMEMWLALKTKILEVLLEAQK